MQELKKKHSSGNTTLIISNEEMNDKMKIFYWKESRKQLKMKQKKQKGGYLSMLLGTLGASLLGNLLTGKGFVRAGAGNQKGKGIVRAGTGKQ